MTDTTQPRTHLTDAEVARNEHLDTALTRIREAMTIGLADADLEGQPGIERIHEWADLIDREVRAAVARLTAELDGARCAALNLLAKERANSGSGRDGHLNEDDLAPLLAALRIDAAPDLGSAPRAQGVAVDGPEIAVDGQTPVTGSRGMGRDASGAHTPAQAVLAEIAAERARQDARWGEQNHPDGTDGQRWRDAANCARGMAEDAARNGRLTWLDIAREELFEAFAETDPAKLRAELVQVAAVAVAWVEAIDRRDPTERAESER